MRQVLVTGAEGFIGRNVLRMLAASGWAQAVADCADPGAVDAPGLRRAPFDVTNSAATARALQGMDAVVDCIAGSPARISAGAEALFAAAARADPPPLIVLLSSMTVYGSARGTVREDAPLTGGLGAYSDAMVIAEACAARYPRAIVLRPGVEFGPGAESWSGRPARWLAARRLGDLGARGDGICNLVYIDDLAAAVLGALRHPEFAGRAFNVAMPDPPTWNEYFIGYARALGAVPVARIGRRRLDLETKVLAVPLKIAERAARAAGLSWSPPPAIPPSLLRVAGQEVELDSTQAREALGWTCMPLGEALARAAQYFTARPATSA